MDKSLVMHQRVRRKRTVTWEVSRTVGHDVSVPHIGAIIVSCSCKTLFFLPLRHFLHL